MNELEDLLRTTLDDPRRRLPADPRHIADFRARARSLRRRRSAMAGASAAAVVAIVAGVGLAARDDGGDASRETPAAASSVSTPTRPVPSAPASPPAISASLPPPAIRTEQYEPVPDAVSAALSDGSVFALTSKGFLQHVEIASGAKTVSRTAVDVPQAPEGSATVIAADGVVWTLAQTGDAGARLTEFDAMSLEHVRTVTVDHYVFSADVLRGELWLATQQGLFRVAAGSTEPERVGTMRPWGLVADREKQRLIVGAEPTIVLYDPATDTKTAQVNVTLGKISIALTKSGQLWVAGYDMQGPVERKIVHLDRDTLAVLGTTTINERVGPGATVHPGESVVWVVNNGGSVTCVDAASGTELTAPLSGNLVVASQRGFAFTVEYGVRRLVLPPSCPG